MATNKYSDGNTVIYSNTSTAITSGTLVVMGTALVGVALKDIAATTGTGPCAVTGEYTLPSITTTGVTFAVGDVLYVNATGGNLTTSSTGNTRVGICTLAKAASTATARVLLNT